MAKQTKEPADVSPVATSPSPEQTVDLALVLSARTGLGVVVLREKLSAYRDPKKIADLLAQNNLSEIMALLDPMNKA